MAKPDPILIADQVTRRFGGLTAVDVEHVEIQRGAITALIGPNGAGKTTFFNLLTGFDTPDTGSWLFNGKDLAGIPAYKVARMGMIRTFQLTKALSKMTVLENMRLGATGQKGERLVSSIFGFLWGAQEKAITDDGPTSCSSASTCTRSARTSPARSPAASASCSRWPGPS